MYLFYCFYGYHGDDIMKLRTLKDLETNTILVGNADLDGKVDYIEREVVYKRDLIDMVKEHIKESCDKVKSTVGKTNAIKEYAVQHKLEEMFNIE